MRADPPLRIGVIGAGTCGVRTRALAEEVGRRIARAGAVLVCGGLGGVMKAAARGAWGEGGMTVGISPWEEAGGGNPYLTVTIPTGMGVGRNVLVVRAAEALVAVGGRWGTLSEVAFALQLGIPLISLKSWRLPGGPPRALSPGQAVAWAVRAARRRRARTLRRGRHGPPRARQTSPTSRTLPG